MQATHPLPVRRHIGIAPGRTELRAFHQWSRALGCLVVALTATTVQVSALPRGAQVEMDGILVLE